MYGVGDDERKHICLEPVCLDSKGTHCPNITATSVSRQLANRLDTNDDRGPETFKRAVEHLGRVVQNTYNDHPNDTSKMTAAMLALASSDNAFRQWVRV